METIDAYSQKLNKKMLPVLSSRLAVVPIIVVMLQLVTPVIVLNIPNGIISGKYFWLFFSSIPSIFLVVLNFRSSRLQGNQTDLLILLFTFYFLLHPLFVEFSGWQTKKYVYIAASLILYFNIRFLSAFEKTVKWVSLCCSYLFGMCIIACIQGILQKSGVAKSFNTTFAITGPFFHPAPFAGLLAGIMPLSLYISYKLYFLTDKSKLFTLLKTSALICTGLILLILPSLESRAALLAMAAGILFLFKENIITSLIRLKRSRNTLTLIIFSLCIILTTVFYLYQMRSESVHGRILVWKIAGTAISEKPIFGQGINSFRETYPAQQVKYFKTHKSSNEQYLATDTFAAFNEPIQLTYELGVIGFLLVVWILYSVFRNNEKGEDISKKLDSRDLLSIPKGAKAGLISFIVFSIFSYPFSLPDLPIVFFALLALSVCLDGSWERSSTLLSNKLTISTALILLGGSLVMNIPRISNNARSYARLATLLSNSTNMQDEQKWDQLRSDLESDVFFTSIYARLKSGNRKYMESNELIQRLSEKNYETIMQYAHNFKELEETDSAIYYYTEAHFLLPNRFLPLEQLMILYNKTNKDQAREIALLISGMPDKVSSTETLRIKESAKKLLKTN